MDVGVTKCPATQTAATTTLPNRNQARHQSQPSARSATPASEGRCHQMPRLPRKVQVYVYDTKCRACHKNGPMCHKARACPTKKVRVDVAKCHACHTKCRSMSPSATPATQNGRRCHQVPRLPHKVKVDAAKCNACRTKKVDVTKSHACPTKWTLMSPSTSQTKWTSMSPSATPATQTAAATTAPNGNQARHQSQPSAISATPATQSEGRCH